jgi:hypothetical protein
MSFESSRVTDVARICGTGRTQKDTRGHEGGQIRYRRTRKETPGQQRARDTAGSGP